MPSTPVVDFLEVCLRAAKCAEPDANWNKHQGRCTVRTTSPIEEWELGYFENSMMHADTVADDCARSCANEGTGMCTGFDVMLQYDYPEMSQCRIYGAENNLKQAKSDRDWEWRSDANGRNDGWPNDVINGADGVSDTFCVGKTP